MTIQEIYDKYEKTQYVKGFLTKENCLLAFKEIMESGIICTCGRKQACVKCAKMKGIEWVWK